MSRFILRRLVHGLVVLVIISLLTFGLLHLGGDPASLMAPDYFSEEDVVELRRKMGLDEPFWVQYGKYLGAAVQGDLGQSFLQRRPALEIVLERLPATIQLSTLAFALTILIAVPLGVLTALKRGTLWDRGGLVLALAGQAVPSFWFGIMLIILLAVQLGWLPSYGGGGWRHLIMPAITLSLAYTGVLTRVVRSSMLEVLGQDYIRTARAKGLGAPAVLVRHALRNTALPTVTVLGLELGSLLSGSVITETVFAYPGVGWLAIQSIRSKDFPVVLAFVIVMAILTLAITLIVDVLYAILDPRVTYT